jgi:acyl-coenzyme A synthetase/AMP-(fatty) acid ligase/3-hydroxymyristoyl/3-hydroxydecanoyl-(acyl carrier protein) dehydratase
VDEEIVTTPLLAQHAPDALIAFGPGGSRTASDLLRDAATVLRELPQGQDGQGALLAFRTDRYAFAVAMLATWARGLRIILPPDLRAETISSQLTSPRLVALLHDTGVSGHLSVPELLAGLPAEPLERPPIPPQIAAEILTSGSTGESKVWAKSADALFAEVMVWRSTLALPPGSKIVATVPAAHLYGFLFSVLLPLSSGGAFCRDTPFLPETIAARVREHQARALVTVPVHLRAMDVVDPAAFASLEWVLSSTAPLSLAVAEAFTTRHHRTITEIFGCTEAGGIASRNRATEERWQPLVGVAVSTTGDNYLTVDSPWASHDLPRPYPTADRVEMSADGTFEFLGRQDSIVKVAGRRLNLQAMEEWLVRLDGVEDAVVLSVPDETRGARVLAALVAPTLTEADVRRALLSAFEPSTLPRRFIFLPRLPREANGKVQRHRVLSLFGLGAEGQPLSRQLNVLREEVQTCLGGQEGELKSGQKRIYATLRVPEDYLWFVGHFNPYPVMAAVVQLGEILVPLVLRHVPEAGALHELSNLKFTGRIAPGAELSVTLTIDENPLLCEFTMSSGDRLMSAGKLAFLPRASTAPVLASHRQVESE